MLAPRRSDEPAPAPAPGEWPRYAAWTVAIAGASAVVTKLVEWAFDEARLACRPKAAAPPPETKEPPP